MAKPYKAARDELDELEAKLAKLKEEQLDITDRMDKLESSRQKLLKRCRELSDKITNRKLRLHAAEPAYCHHKQDFVDIRLVEIPNAAGDGFISRYMKCSYDKGCTWWGSISWYEQERANP